MFFLSDEIKCYYGITNPEYFIKNFYNILQSDIFWDIRYFLINQVIPLESKKRSK